MNRSLLERRLAELNEQLRALRGELGVADEQLAHFVDEADEARLRSLVSETPLAEREHREADRHAETMRRHRSELVASIGRLEESQDDLLDKLIESTD